MLGSPVAEPALPRFAKLTAVRVRVTELVETVLIL